MSWQHLEDWVGVSSRTSAGFIPSAVLVLIRVMFMDLRNLGPPDHDKLDLNDLPVRPGEHYLVKHPTDWYECLKCRKRGPNVRDQPCSFQECPKHASPDDIADTKKIEMNTLEADNEESLLEALLEEEQVLSQMLEEALALSVAEATTGTTQQTNTEEEEMLKEAMALSMQTSPPKTQEQERKENDVEGNQVVDRSEVEEDEENLEEAIALSLQEPRNDSHEPSARPEAADHDDGRALLSELSSEKNRYNMQCLVNMGFSKVQAVWGVKRANEGNGSIDLALQHASWRCDAELLMEKRRKLSHMTMKPPKTSQALCITLSFSRIECMHQYFAICLRNPLLSSSLIGVYLRHRSTGDFAIGYQHGPYGRSSRDSSGSSKRFSTP